MIPFLKSAFMLLLAASSIAVQAAEPKAAAKVDPAKGEALYSKGDGARNIAACVSCHGAAGNSTIVQNPKLAAQIEPYLIKQMAEFASGARSNPIMSPIAKQLSADEIKNLSAYLGAQQPKPGAAKNKASIELGKQIYRGGIASKDVPACASCHSASGAGIPAQFPRLAGQHQEYTAAQLVEFRSGNRKNSEMMTTIASRMSDAEIKAVSDYVAGLR